MSHAILPHFLIIGAQKSGTSSLYHYLAGHPYIFPSSRKEVHFFDGGLNPAVDNYVKGRGWYNRHFPSDKLIRDEFRTFEASPLYLFNPLVPERIFHHLPAIKLIALLRNPTERAISHYFHEKWIGREPLPILEAFMAEEKRLEAVCREADYKSGPFIHNSYMSRGKYKEQLQRFLRHFSRDQIFLISSEEFFRNPQAILFQVFEFIGVPGFRVNDLRPRNVGGYGGGVDPEVYEYLDNYFQPHNQELYELAGKDFHW